jgi:hypothetical protein
LLGLGAVKVRDAKPTADFWEGIPEGLILNLAPKIKDVALVVGAGVIAPQAGGGAAKGNGEGFSRFTGYGTTAELRTDNFSGWE